MINKQDIINIMQEDKTALHNVYITFCKNNNMYEDIYSSIIDFEIYVKSKINNEFTDLEIKLYNNFVDLQTLLHEIEEELKKTFYKWN